MSDPSFERFYKKDRPDDQRQAFQRDRDRLLYSSAFRRLADVTQVASAAEGQIFHNRLTHTLKVAQIARRLAELLLVQHPSEATALGVDPDVAEAAALAHDLGHPPFGHVAEQTLNKLASNADLDGFNGNAQSFRIVTKLAIRFTGGPGLNLTRATLNGLLKYPWYRQTSGIKSEKWGAYHSEEEEFRWTRRHPTADEQRCACAEIMDWADDIAYSVHDVEDFYRAGLIPLHELLARRKEFENFFEGIKVRWTRQDRKADLGRLSEYQAAFGELLDTLSVWSLDEPFVGTVTQRANLRSMTSVLVSRYIQGGIRCLKIPSSPGEPCIEMAPEHKTEVKVLKELVWQYVIENPHLATQQRGQRTVIQELYQIFSQAVTAEPAIFPIRWRPEVDRCQQDDKQRARLVLDLIASMTEAEAIRMYRRLTGVSIGALTDALPT